MLSGREQSDSGVNYEGCFINLKKDEHFHEIEHKNKLRVIPSAGLMRIMIESIKSETGAGFVTLLGFDVEKYGIRSRDLFQYVLFQNLSSSIFNKIGQSKATFSSKIPLYKYNHFTIKEECSSSKNSHEIKNSRHSVSDLHFDPNVLLFAQGYGPMKNAVGGDLIITRVHDYCRDNETSLLDILEYFSMNGQLYPTVKEQYLSPLLNKYSFVIPTCKHNPIVFIDNRISIGVMHGTSPIGVKNQNESLQRYYFYTSIKQR